MCCVRVLALSVAHAAYCGSKKQQQDMLLRVALRGSVLCAVALLLITVGCAVEHSGKAVEWALVMKASLAMRCTTSPLVSMLHDMRWRGGALTLRYPPPLLLQVWASLI
jgi:hypothetical protein